MRICFVCMGNICRSPTAEGVMAKLLADAGLADRVTIDSAGTGDWHAGELADPRTREAATRRGLDLTHRARQFTRADLDQFDLVIAMDTENLRQLQRMVGDRPEPRLDARRGGVIVPELRLLCSFDPSAAPGACVPDPYYGGAGGFDEVLDLCERACAGLLEHVRSQL